ncbi:MAG: hypothetical protein J6K20_01055 [Thermoguttaceae bacterium]|nr:hypothetical protein [Thermoguttaceae bacterium]
MQRINEPNLPRVAAGQSISAADWNRIVDRINAGAPATVRAKTPTARVESQIVQIANVGKRDVKFLQPVFATGVLRVAIPNDADGKPLSGKARFEAELNAALNGACVVEAKDAAESTGEFGTPDFEYTTDDLAFVALEPIPAGGVGRALAACGPIFFADALRGSGQKFAVPYANGTGYFYRSADFGYRVVAETGGDYRRRVALLGYWKNPAPVLTYSTLGQEVVTNVTFEKDEKSGCRPVDNVELVRAENLGMDEALPGGVYDEAFKFHGVGHMETVYLKLVVAARFNDSVYPDSIKVFAYGSGDPVDEHLLKAEGYVVSEPASFAFNNIMPVTHELRTRYNDDIIPKYSLRTGKETITTSYGFEIKESAR